MFSYSVSDLIKCIDNEGVEEHLTLNQIYEVSVPNKSQEGDMVRVIDDTGRYYTFYDWRFEFYGNKNTKKEVW